MKLLKQIFEDRKLGELFTNLMLAFAIFWIVDGVLFLGHWKLGVGFIIIGLVTVGCSLAVVKFLADMSDS